MLFLLCRHPDTRQRDNNSRRKLQCFFLRVIVFFCTDVQFLQCLASQALQNCTSTAKIGLRRSKRTPAVFFLRVVAVFAMRTAKLDIQGDVFAIVKQAVSFLHCFESVHEAVQFLHWNCNFCTAGKICCTVQQLHCFGYFRPHLGAVYSLHWNSKTKQC